MTVQAPGPGRLDLIGMLSQLIECTAVAPAHCRQLLADCQMCRNSVLYLLDPPMDERGSRRLIASRIRNLPDAHRLGHGNPASADAVRPRIRGFTEPVPGTVPRPGSTEDQIARAGEALRERIWVYLTEHGPATAARIAAATGDPETVIGVQCRDAAGRGVLGHDPETGYSIPVFPLSDVGADAEAQADAAQARTVFGTRIHEQLAGFGWDVTGTRPSGLTADQERLFRELTGDNRDGTS